MSKGRHSVLGVLGGMGPLATAAFFRKLMQASEAEPDAPPLPVVVNSYPAVPDRTAFILGRGTDPRPALIHASRALGRAGATLVVIPCNTANVFAADVEAETRLPVVPWLDLAVKSATTAERLPVAILATNGTLEAEVYQSRLAARGADYRVPDERVQKLVMSVIYGPHGIKTRSRWTTQAAKELAEVSDRMADAGCRSLLLACTELPLALSAEEPLSLPYADPADAAVDYSITAIRSA
jgi:aspartate racemase